VASAQNHSKRPSASGFIEDGAAVVFRASQNLMNFLGYTKAKRSRSRRFHTLMGGPQSETQRTQRITVPFHHQLAVHTYGTYVVPIGMHAYDTYICAEEALPSGPEGT
jgi:hypothetical protein